MAALGSPDGPVVVNQQEIFENVDAKLRDGQPPALEYIYVLPPAKRTLPLVERGWSFNPYGHAAVRYRKSDGTQRVFNIVNANLPDRRGWPVVSLSSVEEYFFSPTKSAEGGVYTRNMIGVQISELSEHQVDELDRYFCDLAEKAREGKVVFSVFMGPLYRMLQRMSLWPKDEIRGNCAELISKGFKQAGIGRSLFLLPKAIAIDLLERSQDLGKPAVVVYERPPHSHLMYGLPREAFEAVGPLMPLRNLVYGDLRRFADMVVRVPEGTFHAIAVEADQHVEFPPSQWRNYALNSYPGIAAPVLAACLAWRRVFRR